MNKHGFVFIETIVVTAILLASLMLVYTLFIGTNNKENERIRYDDTAKLYETFYIKKYLDSFYLNELKDELSDTKPYLFIYQGQVAVFKNKQEGEKKFFSKVWNDLHISKIILLKNHRIACDNSIYNGICSDETLYNYLNTLDLGTNTNNRLVIEYSQQLNGDKCTSETECFTYFSSVEVD